jgi:histidine triad (HIT) family protein
VAQDCVFCKLVSGDLPVKAVYQDEEVLAFSDINPQAPVHLLVVPKKHYADVIEASAADAKIISRLFAVISRLVTDKDLLSEGFRVVANTGSYGGQTVKHLHFHVLGGRFMGWPPG